MSDKQTDSNDEQITSIDDLDKDELYKTEDFDDLNMRKPLNFDDRALLIDDDRRVAYVTQGHGSSGWVVRNMGEFAVEDDKEWIADYINIVQIEGLDQFDIEVYDAEAGHVETSYDLE